jgi:sugar O-acyltransferase (sialic acid O-acetyltransferase NeuD family)
MLPIHIIGAGGLGREISAALTHTRLKEKFTLRGFIDDNLAPADVINGIPIQGGIDWLMKQKNLTLFIAIGNNSIRQSIITKLSQNNFNFPTLIHPEASIHDDFFIQIGKGSYIAQATVLTTNIHIGRHTLILPCCSISHDTTIGDCCTLMPDVRITSGATIGNNVHIGPGTIIAKNTTIPSNTTIPPSAIIT